MTSRDGEVLEVAVKTLKGIYAYVGPNERHDRMSSCT